MKKTIRASELFIAILLCFVLSIKLYGQQAFQEISRITLQQNQFFISDIYADGDINGDGRPDLIYAVATNNTSVPYNAQIYIFHDIPDSNSIPDQVLISPVAYTTWYGFSISYSCDLNGDGYDDLVVGAENYGGIDGWGAVFIYYGGVSLSPNPDVTLEGINYDNFDPFWLHFGQKVITDCDLNGDGYADLIVYGDGPQDYWFGHVWAFFGGQQFNTNCAFNKRGTSWYEDFGGRLDTGDINGDGCDDIVLTRRTNIIDETHSDITLEIYTGGISFSTSPSWSKTISTNGEGYIWQLLSNGDLNGDGYDDIMYVDDVYNSNEDSLMVFYGNSDLDSLQIQVYSFNDASNRTLLFFCNADNDIYSDFTVISTSLESGEPQTGCFLLYKQNSASLDLNYDLYYSGETVFSGYGRGYFLGDINQDGYPEFFIRKNDYSVNHVLNYATILTEYYVGNNDDVLPIPVSKVQCYPNPFNPNTTIRFGLLEDSNVKLNIYNIKGQLIKQLVREEMKKGYHNIVWNGKDQNGNQASSGVYIYRISTGGTSISNKMIMLK